MTVFRTLVCTLMLAALLLAVSSSAWATGPFGLSVHASTPEQLHERFPGAASKGINRWSQGPMFEVPGHRLPLEGARDALFIFSADERLDAVVITMNKNRFNAVRGLLDERYRQTRAQVPFVGDAFVAWREQDVIIELDSPHLGFQMTLSYKSSEFVARFEAGRRAEAEARRQREADQL